MSPQTKKRAVNVTITFGAILSALAWGAPRALNVADQRYLQRDSFALHRESLALQRQADSLTHAAEFREMMRILMGIDSAARCRANQTGFCR